MFKAIRACRMKGYTATSWPRYLSAMPEEKELIVSHWNGMKVATINRPKALNALNRTIVDELLACYTKWSKNPSTTAIVLKGQGEKAFCAGGDVKSVTQMYKKGEKETVHTFFKTEYRLNHLISKLKLPYVAILNGITMGGGAGVSLHGTFRIATEKTLFAMPECALGLFTDVGASYFLTHTCPEHIGRYLALTGKRLNGKELKAIGLATHYVPSWRLQYLEDRLKDLNESGNDKESVNLAIKEFEEHVSRDDSILLSKYDLISNCFQRDSIEEIQDQLLLQANKGEAWCVEAQKAIAKASPTSLRVNLELLKRGRALSLSECLKMEYRLLTKFMAAHDFHEGVRALLVDKDNSPKWNPSTLDDVSPQMISEYFSPLTPDEELEFHGYNSKL